MALICFELGPAAAAGAAGGGGGAAAAADDGAGAGAAAASAGAGGAVTVLGSIRTIDRQLGDSCAALARRHSKSSGFVGAIHKQWEVKSSSVQAWRTTLSQFWSGGCDGGGCDVVLAGCGDGELGATVLTALTALPHAGANCAACC